VFDRRQSGRMRGKGEVDTCMERKKTEKMIIEVRRVRDWCVWCKEKGSGLLALGRGREHGTEIFIRGGSKGRGEGMVGNFPRAGEGKGGWVAAQIKGACEGVYRKKKGGTGGGG